MEVIMMFDKLIDWVISKSDGGINYDDYCYYDY